MATMHDLSRLHHMFKEVRQIDPDLPASYPAALVFIAASQLKGQKPRVGDITLGLGMLPPSVSRMLANLERRKFIIRKKDRADGRSMRIQITGRGLELLDRMLGYPEPKANPRESWSPDTVAPPPAWYLAEIDQSNNEQMNRLEKLEAEIEAMKVGLKSKNSTDIAGED